MTLNDESVAIQLAVREGNNEATRLFTFEAGINDSYDIELYVNYSDDVHNLLMLKPVSMINQANLQIRQILTTVNKIATALHNGLSDRATKVNSIDEIQALWPQIFSQLNKIVDAIEAASPESVVSGEDVTIKQIIAESIGLTRANIDNSIQVKGLFLTKLKFMQV